jgi:aminoglycoside phosphotransferase (APT) family kinase protein
MNLVDYFSQHNLPASNLVSIEKRSVNLVYLTDDYVLRIVRPELMEHVNHEREAELALKAFDKGIKTAKPVAWDKTYSIWERLPGHALRNPETSSPKLWLDLLDTLEHLHQNPLELPEKPLNSWVGDSSFIDKTQELALWSDDEKRLLAMFLSESQRIGSPCFIHGDAYADNIMVDDAGNFIGIIDWGNAGWQSLEAECSSLDTSALDLALKRWNHLLDKALLWKMRLNLSLEVASYGRLPIPEVRAVLNQVVKTLDE